MACIQVFRLCILLPIVSVARRSSGPFQSTASATGIAPASSNANGVVYASAYNAMSRSAQQVASNMKNGNEPGAGMNAVFDETAREMRRSLGPIVKQQLKKQGKRAAKLMITKVATR